VPRHQAAYRLRHERIGTLGRGEPVSQVPLQHCEGGFRTGGGGQELAEPDRLGAPQVVGVQCHVGQFGRGQAEQRRRRAGPEPDADQRGSGFEDVGQRMGERSDQPRYRPDPAVQLDATGRQVALQVRRGAALLDPHRADHPRERARRCLLDVAHDRSVAAAPFTALSVPRRPTRALARPSGSAH
jgi:hypothetical protein